METCAELILDENYLYCRICERQFVTYSGLLSHCRDSTHHEWCEPCHMLFRHGGELSLHEYNDHNRCRDCGRFFQHKNNLLMVTFPTSGQRLGVPEY